MIKTPLFILLLLATPVIAEMYKWQDANGRWHFSDTAPAKHPSVIRMDQPDKMVSTQIDSPSETDYKDLRKQLTDYFQPATIIEEVTLAVVGIETAMGQGSGFFLSGDGYIVTNKHVVRPDTTASWQKSMEARDETTRQLQEFKKSLDEESRKLQEYAKKLSDYKQEIDRKSNGSSKSLALEEYREYDSQYQSRKKALQEQQASYKQLSGEHSKTISEFNLHSSMAGAATRFKIYLKDDTQLSANLIHISNELDLALLKLDGYQTPWLSPATDSQVRQGARVFAVGSPMGMRDSVTSGIIARLQQDYLVTDAQILPGNSGGPLLDESGKVLGVNTLKFAEKATADGFGLTIPIATVMTEFRAYLN
jgi:serine protease Do